MNISGYYWRSWVLVLSWQKHESSKSHFRIKFIDYLPILYFYTYTFYNHYQFYHPLTVQKWVILVLIEYEINSSNALFIRAAHSI